MENITENIVNTSDNIPNTSESLENGYKGFDLKKEHVLIVVGALLLGILFNWLFYGKEFGISIPVFVVAFYVLLFSSVYKSLEFRFDLKWALTIPILLLSLTYLFYSNQVFFVLNAMAIPVLIVIQTVLITGNNAFSWHTPGFLIDIIYGFFYRSFAYVARPIKLVTEFFAKRKDNKGNNTVQKILLGLLISVPLLLIVISLLVSADQIFKSYMDRIPNIFENIKLEEYFGRGFFILLIFFTSFSYIYSLNIKKKPEITGFGDGTVKLPRIWDPVVVITIMLLIDAIYLLFVFIQFTYLFGGISLNLPQGFTYSEYARRGFFELIAVTIINFSILMLFIGFTKMDKKASARFIRILYTLLVGCTLVMLVSAYYRMMLYEEAYGFTYLRVFTQAFMIFLLVLFGITLLRIWVERFSLAKPFIITAVIAFVAVNYINVDVIIAKNNIARYDTTHKIDMEYLSVLSFDAVPEIAKLKNSGDANVAEGIKKLLKEKSAAAANYKEWQSFNLSRYKAKQYLE